MSEARPVPSLPEQFVEACTSLFAVPVTEGRVYACRAWVSKPLGNTSMPTPCCFLVAANRVSEALVIATCIRDILDHIFVFGSAGKINIAGRDAIIDFVATRALLLTLAEAVDVFKDIGVPVFHAPHLDRAEVLPIPYVVDAGFDAKKIAIYRPRVPLP